MNIKFQVYIYGYLLNFYILVRKIKKISYIIFDVWYLILLKSKNRKDIIIEDQ